MTEKTARIIVEGVSPSDLLSDVLQSDACVLLDRRGVLIEQIQFRGVDRARAAAWLREAAEDLEGPAASWPA